jgi:hypothetical protein
MEITQFIGTCSSKEIGEMAEKRGKKFSYKKAVQLIKNYNVDLYNDLALNLRNPWQDETNIKKGKILHIVHSAIDYLFLIE